MQIADGVAGAGKFDDITITQRPTHKMTQLFQPRSAILLQTLIHVNERLVESTIVLRGQCIGTYLTFLITTPLSQPRRNLNQLKCNQSCHNGREFIESATITTLYSKESSLQHRLQDSLNIRIRLITSNPQ